MNADRAHRASDSQMMFSLPPLGIYIHLPWCVAKCPYCDFNSFKITGQLPAAAYTQSLIADLDQEKAILRGREVGSIFFGGGTPSLFAPQRIEDLLRAVEQRFALAADLEVTLEANPGTVEHGSFAGYRQAGVNRLSLGVQSFCDTQLAALGRVHSAADSFTAFDEAISAGFSNINLDLMYGLPGQAVDAAVDDLRQALALQPAHVSHYHLTLEPKTAFYRCPPALPNDEETWLMSVACQELLRDMEYQRYEVSAYAKDGMRCKHNLNYWRYGDYVGVGAGAHGKITNGEGQIVRYAKIASPRQYMRRVKHGEHYASRRQVPTADAAFEFLMNALRLPVSFAGSILEARTGMSLSALRPQFEEACNRGLLSEEPSGAWRPTELGMRFLDDLQMSFLPPEPWQSERSAGPAAVEVMHS